MHNVEHIRDKTRRQSNYDMVVVTDWFVEGKAVDVMVSPVLSWTSQSSPPKSMPPPAQGMPGNLTLVLRAGKKALTIDLHPTR